MVKSNGGIIGPDNVTTGGFSGVASGVFKLGEVTDLIRESKWPEVSPFINTVPNSCRFNIASSDNLTRTSDSGNKKTFTMSFWVKRSTFGTDQVLTNITAPSGAQGRVFFEGSTEQLEFHDVSSGGSYEIRYITNRLFRDVSAWYNIVIAVDTTDGTAGDRVKIYVNGVQETSFATATQPSSGLVTSFNSGGAMEIGSQQVPAEFFGGYMSEVINVDGTQLAPTSFGEFNSGSGIWIPKTITGLTFGANGYYLKFTNSGALGEDFSGNDNDFTVNNLTSLDQSTDSPSNNFSTLNPLNVNPANTNTFSEGNLKAQLNGEGTTSTMAMASGNWYMEYKCSGNITQWTGVEEIDSLISLQYTSANKSVALYVGGATMYVNGANQGSGGYGSGWSSGDIGMIAFDADNARVYFGKNGGWWNGSSYGASSPSTYVAATTGKTYYFRFVKGGNTTCDYEVNFGNPSFAISSGNADANGFGNFEYAVPTSYFSLCTNNLNVI
tara:strand:+ start:517 stop:2004 length:1488 start_codon:yes stop_codon:yes gene_type:complete